VDELQGTSGVEIKRVWRPAGQTILRMELTANGCECAVRVHRSLNPVLFDFIAEHAAMHTDSD
jgi:hypothetical protein